VTPAGGSADGRVRSLADFLGPQTRTKLKRLSQRVWGRWPSVRWGNLRRPIPISRFDEFSRGRIGVFDAFVGRFVEDHQAVLRGRVLETGPGSWLTREGIASAVQEFVDIDVDVANTSANVIADLSDPGVLEPDTFDCEIVTTLSELRSPPEALAHLWRALRVDGTMLLAVPGMGRRNSRVDADGDGLWRWTVSSFAQLLSEALPDVAVEIEAFGSVAALVASLHGLSADELGLKALSWRDPRFPVAICACVTKPDLRSSKLS
jgi:hypothetical protein